MAEIECSNNYNDLSVSHGVDAVQFEFTCQRCSDASRSEFVRHRAG